ncbi:hypothetical protein MMC31_006975, partial [Peltigera leucophlebia]|nr:hypothetical protein [Peltigera leucophlebia]
PMLGSDLENTQVNKRSGIHLALLCIRVPARGLSPALLVDVAPDKYQSEYEQLWLYVE